MKNSTEPDARGCVVTAIVSGDYAQRLKGLAAVCVYSIEKGLVIASVVSTDGAESTSQKDELYPSDALEALRAKAESCLLERVDVLMLVLLQQGILV